MEDLQRDAIELSSMAPTATPATASQKEWLLLFVAWAISLVATASALFIGEVMGKMPCVLCWYQRIAMFPLVVVLGVGLLKHDRGMVLSGLVLAVAGWLVAGYHTMLYWRWIEPAVTPCGEGPSCTQAVLEVMGFLDLPMLSWLSFSAIVASLLFTLKRAPHE